MGTSPDGPRVKLAIVSDPELSGFLNDDSLGAITTPVHIIDLGAPEGVPGARRASELASRIPKAHEQHIDGSGPFSSFPECKPKGPAVLASEGGETRLCDDGSAKPRSAIHADLAAVMIEALGKLSVSH